MNCALCNKPKPLRDSHIIPEFLYTPLYDHGHRYVGINGQGRLGRRFLQKGLSEPLLCHDCEQFLNDHYEKPFKRFWFDKKPLPNQLSESGVQIRNIDYKTFKLFHLSILFRCSVAQAQTFSDITLGPHESTLQRMLRSGDPGSASEYPVFGFALVDKHRAPVWKIIIPPFKTRFDGHTAYQAAFGGCMWVYLVSRHRSALMAKAALQRNGFLWIVPERWEGTAALQKASKILKVRSL